MKTPPKPGLLIVISVFFISGCEKQFDNKHEQDLQLSSNSTAVNKPNIILILADDVGYEVPGYTGGQSYATPNIDRLAKQGLQFTQFHSAPNCSPSRVMLLTGKYNFRNYTGWGILDTTQLTIGNLMKDAGYATCYTGKWQLDGGDASIKKFGFDNYLVFQPFSDGDELIENWYRYKNPHIYENGAYLPDSLAQGKYADDLFTKYIVRFMENNLERPFFAMYSISLTHAPFCPTPDDPEFASWLPESRVGDRRYQPSMLKYMDKKVGQLIKKIDDLGLASNTIILFLADNGTPNQFTSLFRDKLITGGKGSTTQWGTNIPAIVRWTGTVQPGGINNNLIDFTDVLATFSDITGNPIPAKYGITDGVSFLPVLTNPLAPGRDWIYCYWKPMSNSKGRGWAQTASYKLYDTSGNTRFYNILNDTLETSPILSKNLTPNERIIKEQLQNVINKMHN